MTQDKNESVAEDTVDSMIDAAQSTTRFAMNAIRYATKATGHIPIDSTGTIGKRAMNGKNDEDN